MQTGKEKNKSFVFSDPENFFPESVKLSALARHEQFKAEDDAIMKSIELLVQYGADVDKGMLFYADREKKYLVENETPLIIACRIGRLDLIRFLLDSGADTSLQHLEKTALDHCRESNQFNSEKEQQEAIKLLQEK
ncbi:hypothetical protein SDC9_176796 [bioreactor metagenome]|uniref:Uncharacterized protein n=1 Tax=bioreactor metagenome TaxID=1076179 RepID=A0A645H0E5_9ZZZZ